MGERREMKKELRKEKENRVIGVTMASVINQWSNMTIVTVSF